MANVLHWKGQGTGTADDRLTDNATTEHIPTLTFCDICKTEFESKHCACLHTDVNVEKEESCNDSHTSCRTDHKQDTQDGDSKKNVRLHGKEEPYICGICQKHFTLNDSLKKHLMIHTGEKLYTCEICDKQFMHVSSLKKHTLVHTGVLAFVAG